MDWRLIAAISLAAGAFCLAVFGAVLVLTRSPAPLPRYASAAPMLVSESELPAASTPSLLSAQQSPFAPLADRPRNVAATAGAAPPSLHPTGEDAGRHGPPKPHAREKIAALTPGDVQPERPARPAEVKRHSAAPQIQTAVPVVRHRGILTPAEIARIRRRLRLSPDQEPAWPAVEAALAEMGREQIALIRRGQPPHISQDHWPPGRLYAVAGPLLQSLRPDQKETVRRLCRSLGFENVASML